MMEKHREVFVERWGERLAARPRLVEVAQEPGRCSRRATRTRSTGSS